MWKAFFLAVALCHGAQFSWLNPLTWMGIGKKSPPSPAVSDASTCAATVRDAVAVEGLRDNRGDLWTPQFLRCTDHLGIFKRVPEESRRTTRHLGGNYVYIERFEKGPRWLIHDLHHEGIVETFKTIHAQVSNVFTHKTEAGFGHCKRFEFELLVTLTTPSGTPIVEGQHVKCNDTHCEEAFDP